jgi:hypothetical protein
MRRLEIVLLSPRRGIAVIETYIGARRTGISTPLTLDAARVSAAEMGLPLVDHTKNGMTS